MNITKQHLKRIIQEEMKSVLSEIVPFNVQPLMPNWDIREINNNLAAVAILTQLSNKGTLKGFKIPKLSYAQLQKIKNHYDLNLEAATVGAGWPIENFLAWVQSSPRLKQKYSDAASELTDLGYKANPDFKVDPVNQKRYEQKQFTDKDLRGGLEYAGASVTWEVPLLKDAAIDPASIFTGLTEADKRELNDVLSKTGGWKYLRRDHPVRLDYKNWIQTRLGRCEKRGGKILPDGSCSKDVVR